MTKKHKKFEHLGKNLKIQMIACEELSAYQSNPRQHSSKQIEQIKKSIQNFGFTNPILIDANNVVIAGHGRLEAAKKLSIKAIPTILLNDLTPEQVRAYRIADNKLAENSQWDMSLLASEFEFLSQFEFNDGLEITGFETTEIDLFLNANENNDEHDKIEQPPENPVTQLGDLWLIGNHKIYCGDSTKEESYKVLFDNSDKAQVVFTDPPYNVPVNGHICGNGKIQHDEFLMASGEMSQDEFTKFLKTVFGHLCSYSKDGSLHYICMDWRHIEELMRAGSVYDELKNLCVWNKTNGGMGSLYRSKHELVFVYKNGSASHINNIELGKNGRYRTNVWDYAGVNTFQNKDDLKIHPTVKPVAMIKDALLDCSKRGDIVLDVFGGSGSTMVAAQEINRKSYLVELDPKYVDVTINRMCNLFGLKAIHSNGQPFEKIKEERKNV